MQKAFLYIDILAFESLVRSKSAKVERIFKIFDSLKVFQHHALETIVFSDTIIVFSKDEGNPIHYYFTFLTEYSQQLFYKLSEINIYFKAILCTGEFNFKKLTNFQAYHGQALIDAYKDEKCLPGFGRFVKKQDTGNINAFIEVPLSEEYNFVILCQSFSNLYRTTSGFLPVDDVSIFEETDTFFRIEEDIRFLREINHYRFNIPCERIREKYEKVYSIYKSTFPLFFEKFETYGFDPFILHADFTPRLNPEEIDAIEDVAGMIKH